MPKKAPVLTCTEEDRATLDRWIRSRTIEARLVERAKIIMKCIQGQSVLQIAKDLEIRPNTVIDWRRRFQGQVCMIYRGRGSRQFMDKSFGIRY